MAAFRLDIHPHVISPDTDKYPLAPVGGKRSVWSADKVSLTPGQLVEAMDRAGVAKAALVHSSTTYGFDNSLVADAIAAYPDRFTGVCSVDVLAPDAVEKLRAQNERSICEAWTCEKPSLGGGRWFHSQTSNRSRYMGLGSLSLVETSNPGTYRTVSLGSRCVQLHSKSQEYLSWGHGDGTLKHWGMSPHECGTNGQFSGKLLAVHDLNHIMPGLLKVLYSIRHMSHPL